MASPMRKRTQRKADDKRAHLRARAWQCVVYPESAPDDWLEKLHRLGVPYDVSPLHDKDKKPDGGYKKPHHHVVFDWGEHRVASANSAIECFKAIGGVYPDPLKSEDKFLEACKVKKLISAQRYLCHLDEHDPDKTQYDITGVQSGFHDVPFADRILKAYEKDEMCIAMTEYIDEQEIFDFASFVNLAKVDHPEWMHEVINGRGGSFVRHFIAGKQVAVREKRAFEKEIREREKWEFNRQFYERGNNESQR